MPLNCIKKQHIKLTPMMKICYKFRQLKHFGGKLWKDLHHGSWK